MILYLFLIPGFFQPMIEGDHPFFWRVRWSTRRPWWPTAGYDRTSSRLGAHGAGLDAGRVAWGLGGAFRGGISREKLSEWWSKNNNHTKNKNISTKKQKTVVSQDWMINDWIFLCRNSCGAVFFFPLLAQSLSWGRVGANQVAHRGAAYSQEEAQEEQAGVSQHNPCG